MTALPNTIRISLLTLLLVTPWLFGGVWARVQWVLMLLLAVLLAMDLVARFGDEDRPNLVPVAWLPLLAGICLGVFQLIPWPPGIANWLAPESLHWRGEFLTAVASTTDSQIAAERDLGAAQPLEQPAEKLASARTLYQVATREYLALLCLGAAVFVLASLHLIDKQSVLWFLLSIAICGAALSFFGLVQRLSWNGKFYWVFEPLYGGFESFGPFVNRNNAGGFLNLCLAAGIGLLVWAYWGQLEAFADETPSRSGRRRSSAHRSRRRSSTRTESDRSRVATEVQDDVPSDQLDQTLEGTSWEVTSKVSSDDPVMQSAGAEPGTTTEDADASPAKSSDADLAAADQRARQPKESREHRSSARRRSHKKKREFSSASYPLSYERSGRSNPFASLPDSASDFLADLTARRVWAFTLVGITAGGVLCTASRGSILAMFLATMVTSATLALKSGSRKYALALLVVMLAGGGLMSWAGQSEFVQYRFDKMFDESHIESGRIPNWVEALKTVPEFWIAGTGLGTYRFVYERFQSRYLRDIAHFHAENQYVQALVEGGAIALFLLIAAIVLTAMAILRLYKSGGAVNTAVAIAGTFALTSQVVGGTFDFGLYIPSNTMLMAAVCGVVIGRAALLSVWPAEVLDSDNASRSTYTAPPRRSSQIRSDAETLSDGQTVAGSARSRRAFRSRRSPKNTRQVPWLALDAPPSLVTIVVGVLLLGCLFGSLEMNKAAKIEIAMRQASLEEISEIDDPDRVSSIISPLSLALPQRWDDALAHRRMAELRMQLYRATTYRRLLTEKQLAEAGSPAEERPDESLQTDGEVRDDELWVRSSVWHLHGTIRDLQRQGDSTAIQALVHQPLMQESLLPASQHVLLARQVAPTVPQLHLMLAELAVVYQPQADDRVHLDRARILAPGDASMWYWTGLLDLNSHRIDRACASWNNSLTLSSIHLGDVMESARGKLTVRQLLDKVVPPRADMLLRIATKYFGGEDKASFRDEFLKRAEESLDRTEIPLDQLAWVTATVYRLQGRDAEAEPFLLDAVLRNGTNLQWRFQYARLLMDLEEYEKALEQVTHLTMTDPNSLRYKRLYDELNSKRHRVGAPN